MNEPSDNPSNTKIHTPPPPPVFYGDKILQSYDIPAAASNCNMCGTGDGVTSRPVTRDYVPPLAYLTLMCGLLIGVIIIMILRVRHKFDLPFCTNCWKRSRTASLLEGLGLFGFFVSIIFGAVLFFNFDNLMAVLAASTFGRSGNCLDTAY
jgi:hypothetical protein